jgi:hypothetical protein
MPEDQHVNAGPGIRPTAIAWKRLQAVETIHGGSNQHELNGTKALEAVLGRPVGKVPISTRFLLLADDEEFEVAAGTCTWRDARERDPSRSELRLYFPGNEVTHAMRPDDFLALFRRPDGSLAFVVCRSGSDAELRLRGLLKLTTAIDHRMSGVSAEEARLISVEPRFRSLAIELGLYENPIDDTLMQRALALGGGNFPSTNDMSRLAAETADIPPGADADLRLELLLAHEEALFRKVEAALLQGQLSDACKDVESFVDVANSVLNRRKSRAGAALENHVHALLKAASVKVEPQAVTEENNRPDFLMPGAVEYHNPAFPSTKLAMLAVKRTLKDRWRQVLKEADRINQKHLLTMETGLSESQLQSMKNHNLLIVVPKGVRDRYPERLHPLLMSVEEMIADIKKKTAP